MYTHISYKKYSKIYFPPHRKPSPSSLQGRVDYIINWLGHIERMQDTRMVKAIYSWKPISRRPIGRPKTHWVDDARKDIQKLKVPNWKTLAQDRGKWKELVEKAKTL